MFGQNQLTRERKLLSRLTILLGGNAAIEFDRDQFKQATLFRFALQADLLQLQLDQCPYRRAIYGIDTVDISYYTEDWATIKEALIADIQLPAVERNWDGFKRRLAGKVHYKWILSSVAPVYDSPKLAYQWVCFDERLLVTPPISLSDSKNAYREADAARWANVYPPDVVDMVRREITDMFGDFSFGEELPRPKFGPGSFAGHKGWLPRLDKAEKMVYDPVAVDKLCNYFGCEPSDLIIGEPYRGSDTTDLYTNEILFVPKNARKRRIISKEPLWLTWLQQSLKRPLYRYIDLCPKIGSDFRSQDRSRKLALKGSIDGSLATIDFSEASDSITVHLVEQLFRDTYILEPLLLTRSKWARLDKHTTICLSKFAPMGSATCFATMDAVIVGCIRAANRVIFGRPDEEYVVYGDDAILRTEAVATFEAIATALGLSVNITKSYTSSTETNLFRESCGIECLNGIDITPLRYSRRMKPLEYVRSDSKAQMMLSMNDMANAAMLHGYTNLRHVIFEVMKHDLDSGYRSLWYQIPRIDYSDYTGQFGIIVPDGTATNFRCKRRYNADLQRMQLRQAELVARTEDAHKGRDDTLLDLWFFYADLEDDSEWGGTSSGAAGYVNRDIRVRWK